MARLRTPGEIILENQKLKNQISRYKQVARLVPYLDDSTLKGGYRIVSSIEERDKIDCCYRKQGMVVAVIGHAGHDPIFTEYRLLATNCSNTWEEILTTATESTVALVEDYSQLEENLQTQRDLNQVIQQMLLDFDEQLETLELIDSKIKITEDNNFVIIGETQLDFNNRVSEYSTQISAVIQSMNSSITALNNAIFNINSILPTKLDKTTNTISGPDIDFKYIYLTDEINQTRRMLAGDLGKNIANSSLTSLPGSGMTLGSTYTWNVAGQFFYMTNLPDRSSDSTFNRIITQDVNGQLSYSNGKQLLLNLPNILTTAEKEQYSQSWNNQYSNGLINIYSVTPPIIKREHIVKYIVLQGLNLNTNPAFTSVKFIPVANALGVGEIDVLGFQTFSDGRSMIVTVYGDSLADGVSYNLVVRITSPTVQTHRTVGSVLVSSLVDSVDLSGTTWTKKIYNDAVNDGVFGSAGAGQYQSSSTVKAYANEAVIVSALKSSQIISANQDFYLNFDVTVNFTTTGSTVPSHSIGVMLAGATLDLLVANVAAVRIVARADSHIRQIHLDNSNIFAATTPTNPDSFNYTIMRRGSIVYFILSKNGIVYNYSKAVTTEALSFAMFNSNQINNVNISFNIVELIIF